MADSADVASPMTRAELHAKLQREQPELLALLAEVRRVFGEAEVTITLDGKTVLRDGRMVE